MKFDKLAKKRQVLQFFASFFFQIYQIAKYEKLICLYFRKNKSVIFQIFRSKKLQKILEIRQIREKTTSFTILSLNFFFNLPDC